MMDRQTSPREADAEPDDRRPDDAASWPDGETRPRIVTPTDRAPAPSDTGSVEGEKAEAPPPPLPSKWPFIVVGCLVAGLLAWAGFNHWQVHEVALRTQEQTAAMVPEVQTTTVKRLDAPIDLVLPGQSEAFDSALIFPRATGYVAERRVDIGSRVRKGDLLIRIAAPDLDQQLAQAQAQLGQVRAALAQAQAQVGQADANLALAKTTYGRTDRLTQQGYETLQNNDNQRANVTTQQASMETAHAGVAVAEANIKSQQATVDRLTALAAFEDVTAPFDGVVTARATDVGDLLNADSSTGTALFTIARDDVLRIQVYVPQSGAIGIHEGLDADVTVSQMPGRVFKGEVARSSVALNAASRSLMTEIDVPNPDGALRPGLYVSVRLAVPRDHPSVEVPAEALIFDRHGMRVAVLDADSKVRLQPITIERDLGTVVDVKDGLKGGEEVVLSPPATLDAGAKVKADPPPPS